MTGVVELPKPIYSKEQDETTKESFIRSQKNDPFRHRASETAKDIEELTNLIASVADPTSVYSTTSSTHPLLLSPTSNIAQAIMEPSRHASTTEKMTRQPQQDDGTARLAIATEKRRSISTGGGGDNSGGKSPKLREAELSTAGAPRQSSNVQDRRVSVSKDKGPSTGGGGGDKEKLAAGAALPTKDKSETKTGSKGNLNSSSNNMIGTHYKVGKKIGEGSFGVIYEGLNMLNNVPIAIKFEPRKSDAPQLRDEYKTYRLLANSVGIPNAYYFGQEGLHNVLCIDLLGPSLEDMFDLCHRKFSVKTTCMVAKQMITRVQTIHEKNLIYRDIKPDNFLIGRLSRHEPLPILQSHSATHPHSASIVYMVDFGMAKQYRDPKTKVHIPYREKKSLSGTARYMSVNTHLGREQSRRDDLEALGHVFFYFLRGSLPWQGLKAATNKQKYEKIGEKKQSTPIKELCEGHPDEFSLYQQYVKDLKFDEQPDYDYLKGLMNKVLAKNGFIDDGIYDWMIELDHQRNKKERQRASEQQKKTVDASAVAVHQSMADGVTSTNGLAPPTPVPPISVSQTNNLAPSKSPVDKNALSKESEPVKANTGAPAAKESAKDAPRPKRDKEKETEPKESTSTKKKEEKPVKKSFWASCCGGGGEN